MTIKYYIKRCYVKSKCYKSTVFTRQCVHICRMDCVLVYKKCNLGSSVMHLSYQAIKKTVRINETTGILNCTFDIYGVSSLNRYPPFIWY